MYAIIRTGAKEYKVAKGDIIEVEKLEGEVGSKLELPDVLLTGDKGKVSVGTPLVKGFKVTAEVLDQKKAPKVNVFKFKRRKNYIRTKGHRQQITILKILSIGGSKAKAEETEKPAAKADKPETTAKKEKPAAEPKKIAEKAKKPAAKAAKKPATETKKKTTKTTKKPAAETKAKTTETTKKPASETKKKTETKKKKSTE
jgi:large subunit ribosomal protein L21